MSVIVLETPTSLIRSADAPWNPAGYSIAPTPTIAACPAISRGIEWTVPSPPGLVSDTVVPAKSATVRAFVRARRTRSS